MHPNCSAAITVINKKEENPHASKVQLCQNDEGQTSNHTVTVNVKWTLSSFKWRQILSMSFFFFKFKISSFRKLMTPPDLTRDGESQPQQAAQSARGRARLEGRGPRSGPGRK